MSLCVAGVAACPLTLAASEPAEEVAPLVTDRPDQTESSSTVPLGAVQVELGWTRSHNDDDGTEVSTDALPELLVRYGLSERLELRFGFDGLQASSTDTGAGDVESSASGDSSVGLKYSLLGEESWRPETALLAGITLPTGSSTVSSKRSDPSVRLLCSHTISDSLGLSYNVGAEWASEEDVDGDRHTLSVFVWTIALGAEVTEDLGAFVELFGESGLSQSGAPSNSVDGGLTYLVQPNLQLDAAVGFGLSDAADDWFVSFGVSYRFPQ